MKKRRIITIMLCIISLLFYETFAWFLTKDHVDEVSKVYMRYNNGDTVLLVEPRDFNMEIWYFDKTGNKYIKWNSSDGHFTVNGLVPNEVIRFKIRLTNFGELPKAGHLSLRGIQFDRQAHAASEYTDKYGEGFDPLEMFYVSLMPGDGYVTHPNPEFTIPDSRFVCLADGTESEGGRALTLYSAVQIPVCNTEDALDYNDYVELEGYIWLDSRAENEYQNVSLTIDSFAFVS